jgi:hypothetical protein
MEPTARETPRISLRDGIALLHALGLAMTGVARLSREAKQYIQYRQRKGQGTRMKSSSDQIVVLYRPVGQAERDLIATSGFHAFPPRLPHQPIFYPVLSEGYATTIARDWNTKDAASGYAGYVTRFAVCADFLANYPIKTVGSSDHQEYWIPAEDLAAFNSHIIGSIEVISTYSGEGNQ